jgi:hypothetical protein
LVVLVVVVVVTPKTAVYFCSVKHLGRRCFDVLMVDGQWWKKYRFGTLEIFVANNLWLRLEADCGDDPGIIYDVHRKQPNNTSFAMKFIIGYILFEY